MALESRIMSASEWRARPSICGARSLGFYLNSAQERNGDERSPEAREGFFGIAILSVFAAQVFRAECRRESEGDQFVDAEKPCGEDCRPEDRGGDWGRFGHC